MPKRGKSREQAGCNFAYAYNDDWSKRTTGGVSPVIWSTEQKAESYY